MQVFLFVFSWDYLNKFNILTEYKKTNRKSD